MCAKNIPDFNNLFSEYYAHILYVCSSVTFQTWYAIKIKYNSIGFFMITSDGLVSGKLQWIVLCYQISKLDTNFYEFPCQEHKYSTYIYFLRGKWLFGHIIIKLLTLKLGYLWCLWSELNIWGVYGKLTFRTRCLVNGFTFPDMRESWKVSKFVKNGSRDTIFWPKNWNISGVYYQNSTYGGSGDRIHSGEQEILLVFYNICTGWASKGQKPLNSQTRFRKMALPRANQICPEQNQVRVIKGSVPEDFC